MNDRDTTYRVTTHLSSQLINTLLYNRPLFLYKPVCKSDFLSFALCPSVQLRSPHWHGRTAKPKSKCWSRRRWKNWSRNTKRKRPKQRRTRKKRNRRRKTNKNTCTSFLLHCKASLGFREIILFCRSTNLSFSLLNLKRKDKSGQFLLWFDSENILEVFSEPQPADGCYVE